ncbi:hypothetical protein J9253_09580 [Thiothrix litoralis]|uniref:Uncharacterized protein n=1 Tax=Thiothrix litoralis TaxID=2891210 RepID=A0ABX7WWY1_9GAMM|nr:hypothetical protein [Thiothrix litoralis]QTR48140.1 hypothetical protein J9253_09580 [Thiothrix litoralis]
MIEAYFAQIERVLQAVPNAQNLTLRKTLYNDKQGYIAGSIVFEGGDRLDFAEVKNTDHAGKVKYRYPKTGSEIADFVIEHQAAITGAIATAVAVLKSACFCGK